MCVLSFLQKVIRILSFSSDIEFITTVAAIEFLLMRHAIPSSWSSICLKLSSLSHSFDVGHTPIDRCVCSLCSALYIVLLSKSYSHIKKKFHFHICYNTFSFPGKVNYGAIYHIKLNNLLGSSCIMNFSQCRFLADFHSLSKFQAQVM